MGIAIPGNSLRNRCGSEQFDDDSEEAKNGRDHIQDHGNGLFEVRGCFFDSRALRVRTRQLFDERDVAFRDSRQQFLIFETAGLPPR